MYTSLSFEIHVNSVPFKVKDNIKSIAHLLKDDDSGGNVNGVDYQ